MCPHHFYVVFCFEDETGTSPSIPSKKSTCFIVYKMLSHVLSQPLKSCMIGIFLSPSGYGQTRKLRLGNWSSFHPSTPFLWSQSRLSWGQTCHVVPCGLRILAASPDLYAPCSVATGVACMVAVVFAQFGDAYCILSSLHTLPCFPPMKPCIFE